MIEAIRTDEATAEKIGRHFREYGRRVAREQERRICDAVLGGSRRKSKAQEKVLAGLRAGLEIRERPFSRLMILGRSKGLRFEEERVFTRKTLDALLAKRAIVVGLRKGRSVSEYLLAEQAGGE